MKLFIMYHTFLLFSTVTRYIGKYSSPVWTCSKLHHHNCKKKLFFFLLTNPYIFNLEKKQKRIDVAAMIIAIALQ